MIKMSELLGTVGGVFLLSLVVVVAIAEGKQSPQRGVLVYGPTDTSCGTWLADAGEERRAHLKWWVAGVVSGAARELWLKHTPVRETDLNGIETWITKYCTDHPLDGVVKAAFELVDELKGTKR